MELPSNDATVKRNPPPEGGGVYGALTFERDRYYLFYGLVEGDEAHSIIRIKEAGQVDRLPLSARELFNSLR